MYLKIRENGESMGTKIVENRLSSTCVLSQCPSTYKVIVNFTQNITNLSDILPTDQQYLYFHDYY
jgi:hypothetical protein